jgi:hypothetical protein
MNMTIRDLTRCCIIAPVTALMAGCSTSVMVAPSALIEPMPARDLQLATPIVYRYKLRLGVKEIALLPGIYRGIGEDERGVWYLGNRESMTDTVLERGIAIGYPKEWIGIPTVASGGLYVPHDTALPPQVFVIYQERPFSGPNILPQSKKPVDGPSDSQEVAVTVALDAQAANPALAGSPVTAGIGVGVAAGIVAGIIAMDKEDWGKYRIHDAQPPADADLRGQFSIRVRQ